MDDCVVKELIEVAKSLSLNVSGFSIHYVKDQEMNELYRKGYPENEFFFYNDSNEYNLPEIFVFGKPHQIFLNKNNSFEMNCLALAHCLGHIDFVDHHNIFNNLRKHDKVIRHELKRYINEVIQKVDVRIVKHFIYDLKMLYHYTWSNIHDQFVYFKKEIEKERILRFDLYAYVIDNHPTLEQWQKELAMLYKHESIYFYGIGITKLMNEGWASYFQDQIIKELTFPISKKLELARLEAAVHEKERKGINLYSLGRRLWEHVPQQKRKEVKQQYIDPKFIEQFYNEQVHRLENISFSKQGMLFSNYQQVKCELIQSFQWSNGPRLVVDLEATEHNGSLTIRYIQDYYAIDYVGLHKFKNFLERFIGEKVYIKPLFKGKK